MEYYSAIKRNEIGSFVETWMHLETVIQSEVSQEEKNKYHILMHVCGTLVAGVLLYIIHAAPWQPGPRASP